MALTRAITLLGNAGTTATIDSSGTGPLSIATVTNSFTTLTLGLAGTYAGINSMGAALADAGANALALNVSGSKWSLNNANTFTGATTVAAGATLILGNAGALYSGTNRTT